MKHLQLSQASDLNEQLLEFLHAINNNLKEAMTAGDSICLDEYMVKKGKMKIKSKPSQVENEPKTMCDGRSKIVMHIELMSKSLCQKKIM